MVNLQLLYPIHFYTFGLPQLCRLIELPISTELALSPHPDLHVSRRRFMRFSIYASSLSPRNQIYFLNFKAGE